MFLMLLSSVVHNLQRDEEVGGVVRLGGRVAVLSVMVMGHLHLVDCRRLHLERVHRCTSVFPSAVQNPQRDEEVGRVVRSAGQVAVVPVMVMGHLDSVDCRRLHLERVYGCTSVFLFLASMVRWDV